jgi:hypothetical protein
MHQALAQRCHQARRARQAPLPSSTNPRPIRVLGLRGLSVARWKQLQPLTDLAQRGTLDTHAAGLTGLGGTRDDRSAEVALPFSKNTRYAAYTYKKQRAGRVEPRPLSVILLRL